MPAVTSVQETPHGLQVTFDGRPLYGNRPRDSARHRTDELQVQSDTLILCFSPVAWHGIDTLLARLPDDSAIMAIEAEPELLEIARARMPATTPERLCLVAASSDSVLGQLRKWGITRFRRTVQVSTNAGTLLHRAEYRALAEAIDQQIRVAWQNRMTISAMGSLWVRNVIRNCVHQGQPHGLAPIRTPVVVCGAGPSLDAALGVVVENRARLTVIAVDTAAPILEQRGVMPDLVVAVEGQIANLYDFLPVSNRDYLLVADMVSCPSAVEQHPRVAWILSEFADLSFLSRLHALRSIQFGVAPLGSVGVVAVAVALHLARSMVFTAGLDFAYCAGRTHARGAPAGFSALARTSRLAPLNDAAFAVRGMPADSTGTWRTTLPMVSYAEDLRGIAADDTARSGMVRLRAIEPSGLDGGYPGVAAAEAGRLITAPPESLKSPPGSDDSRERVEGSREEIQVFVRSEIEALDGLSELLSRPDVRRAGRPLSEALAYCDYVYFDFPDAPGPDDRSESFMNRVRIRTDYYRSRWAMALTLLRS